MIIKKKEIIKPVLDLNTTKNKRIKNHICNIGDVNIMGENTDIHLGTEFVVHFSGPITILKNEDKKIIKNKNNKKSIININKDDNLPINKQCNKSSTDLSIINTLKDITETCPMSNFKNVHCNENITKINTGTKIIMNYDNFTLPVPKTGKLNNKKYFRKNNNFFKIFDKIINNFKNKNVLIILLIISIIINLILTFSYIYNCKNYNKYIYIDWKKIAVDFNDALKFKKTLNKLNILSKKQCNDGIDKTCYFDLRYIKKKNIIRFISSSFIDVYQEPFSWKHYYNFEINDQIGEKHMYKFINEGRFMYCRYKNETFNMDNKLSSSVLLIGIPYCYPGNTTSNNYLINIIIDNFNKLINKMEKNNILSLDYNIDIYKGCINTPFDKNMNNLYKTRINLLQ